ncbi:MAG: recombinase RecA [Chloroflexi bacterium]|nr:recombinase RecA [Chloroflexota bacterium]
MSDKEQALELALGQIERQFGRGSIMRMGEVAQSMHVEAIPTGSISLDLALGIGGIPRGRIIEIYGAESAGKSTLCHHIVAEAQRLGGTAAYIDAEHAMDPSYAARCGVDIDTLLISQPDSGEQALEIVEYLVRSGALDVVVIDSVAALAPRAELEGDMGDAHVGLQARLMSQALRKLTAATNHSNTAVVFVNQLREKVGVFFGSPEVTPGGRALKFYSSVRIDLRRIETIKQQTEAVGTRVRAKVVKNKVAPPFKQAEFDIMFNVGISKVGDLLDLGTTMDLLRKSGANYSFGETKLGQGRENAKEFLKTHPEIADELERQVRGVDAGTNGHDAKAAKAVKDLPELEEAAVGAVSD